MCPEKHSEKLISKHSKHKLNEITVCVIWINLLIRVLVSNKLVQQLWIHERSVRAVIQNVYGTTKMISLFSIFRKALGINEKFKKRPLIMIVKRTFIYLGARNKKLFRLEL